MSAPAAKTRPPPDPCAVGAADLQRIGLLHQLLEALNDPFVSRGRIEKLSRAFPPLSARIFQRARRQMPQMDIDTLAKALAIIGNRGIEASLLELLEDLTVYKSEMDNP